MKNKIKKKRSKNEITLAGTIVLFMMVVIIVVVSILLYFTTCNVKNCKEKNNLREI